MFRTVGDYLKYALQKQYISESDFYTTDKEVLAKAGRFLEKDEKLRMFFARMNNKIKITNNPDNFDASVFCKSRVVDPLFKSNGPPKRLSEAYPAWGGIIERESKPKQYFLKFEK